MRGRSVIEINTLGTLAVQHCTGCVATGHESPYPPTPPPGSPSTGGNLGVGQGACRCLALKQIWDVSFINLLFTTAWRHGRALSANQDAPHFHPEKCTDIRGHYRRRWTTEPEVDGSSVTMIIYLKVTPKLHICNTALLFLPVLNWAGGLTTVTVFHTLSILRPRSEKLLYLALVGGSVFSSAWRVFL